MFPTAPHFITFSLSVIHTQVLESISSLQNPIFPGDETIRRDIDSMIIELEDVWKDTIVFNDSDSGSGDTTTAAAAAGLLGLWKLEYASNGTYVTRSAPAQALLALSSLPIGFGLADVEQELSPDNNSNSSGKHQLSTNNVAVFGLGPLGRFKVAIEGTWSPSKSKKDGKSADVKFGAFSVKMNGFLGLPLPDILPEMKIPISNGRTAVFKTTYLSNRMRIARGKSDNVFLFTKQ